MEERLGKFGHFYTKIKAGLEHPFSLDYQS